MSINPAIVLIDTTFGVPLTAPAAARRAHQAQASDTLGDEHVPPGRNARPRDATALLVTTDTRIVPLSLGLEVEGTRAERWTVYGATFGPGGTTPRMSRTTGYEYFFCVSCAGTTSVAARQASTSAAQTSARRHHLVGVMRSL